MPKLKSNRGAAKRFKQTASGKFKRSQGYMRATGFGGGLLGSAISLLLGVLVNLIGSHHLKIKAITESIQRDTAQIFTRSCSH